MFTTVVHPLCFGTTQKIILYAILRIQLLVAIHLTRKRTFKFKNNKLKKGSSTAMNNGTSKMHNSENMSMHVSALKSLINSKETNGIHLI